ncbi:MAG: IclR family transcriptional regulator [Roseovarius sp.]|nr:IclR family transcriptional regulator [Roseovarius sp.]
MLIRSVVRAFAVFECFTEDAQRLTLHEICQKLDLPKSTVFRLLNTLVEIGYLHHLDDQSYCISLRVMRLASLVPSTLDVRNTAKSELRKLGELTGETVSLSILEGNERIVLDVIESPSRLRSIVRIGEVVNLQAGAVGRVFMAWRDEALIEAVYDKDNQPPTLRSELAEVREQGYACTNGDRVAGASGIAAPIFDMNGVCEYSVSIAGPELRIMGKQDEYVDHLVTSTRRISRILGHSVAP